MNKQFDLIYSSIYFICLYSIFFFFISLSGCTGTSGLLPLNGDTVKGVVDAATDRHAVWGQVEIAKLTAIGKIADAEKAKAEAQQQEVAQVPVINPTTDAQVFAVVMSKAFDQMARSVELLGQALLAKETKSSIYTAGITFYKQPMGVVESSIREFLGGTAKIASTPLASIAGGGWAAGYLAGKVNDGAKGYTFNGDVAADNSFNSSVLHQTGSSSSTASLAPMAVDPIVVEPISLEVTE